GGGGGGGPVFSGGAAVAAAASRSVAKGRILISPPGSAAILRKLSSPGTPIWRRDVRAPALHQRRETRIPAAAPARRADRDLQAAGRGAGADREARRRRRHASASHGPPRPLH